MIQLRKAIPADFEQVLVLFRQNWPDMDFSVEALQSIFNGVINDPRKRYFCAVDGQHIVGLGSVSYHDNLLLQGEVANIEELIVHNDFKELGIEARLIDHLSVLAKLRDCRRIECDVSPDDAKVQALFASQKFEKRAVLLSRAP